MKAQLKIKHCLAIVLGILSLAHPVHAAKIGASGNYPVAAGSMGQAFLSNPGFSIDFYPDPLLDPKIDNFISVGYESLTIRADGESSYRIIPILIGLELPAKFSDDLKVTLGGAVGAAVTYFNTPGLASIHTTMNLAAQINPGLEWDTSKDFAIRAQVPITYLFAYKSLTYLAYTLGFQFNLGGSGDGK